MFHKKQGVLCSYQIGNSTDELVLPITKAHEDGGVGEGEAYCIWILVAVHHGASADGLY